MLVQKSLVVGTWLQRLGYARHGIALSNKEGTKPLTPAATGMAVDCAQWKKASLSVHRLY